MRIVTNYWVTFCFTYVFDSHADLCLIPPESIPFKPESESNLARFITSPRNQNRNQFRWSKVGIGIDSVTEWPIPAANVPKWPVCPKTLGPRCYFYRAILQPCLLPETTFIHIFDVFRGGSVMDPATWNQNGIDSGAQSPESEPIFSS